MEQRELTWLHAVNLVYVLFVLVFLPAAFKFRSPGGISAGRDMCALVTGAILICDSFALKAEWHSRVSGRLWCYVYIAVAVGVVFLLVHAWQEQEQYDHWAHRGIPYFDGT